jgi:putative DNA primase/helicase
MHEGLVEYKQRMLGTCLSGEFLELLFLIFGMGSNGKSTELQIICRLMGDYAHSADAGILIAKKETTGATPELVDLMGRRVVFINETGQGDVLNEARRKLPARDRCCLHWIQGCG